VKLPPCAPDHREVQICRLAITEAGIECLVATAHLARLVRLEAGFD
jgi:hypothetical protein